MSSPDYQIPGTSTITAEPITVTTDGGPWAEHNFPCPICRSRVAVIELDGWAFHPCRDCERNGWVTVWAEPGSLIHRFIKWVCS